MVIKGKRIRSIQRHLRGVPTGVPVVIALEDAKEHSGDLEKAGFSATLVTGEARLPARIGRVSTYNAEGDYLIHRDQPMETAYRQQEWTWEEWHGPYTETQSRIVDVPYKRYPRTFLPPPSVELTIVELPNRAKALAAQPVLYDDKHEQELLHTINLFLELFGECSVLTEGLEAFIGANVRRLNWTVLPPGEMPWAQLQRRLKPLLDEMGDRSRPVVENRLKVLTKEHKTDFTAVGIAGFEGYLVFGYKAKGIYVLESLRYGNATYVLGEGWEQISQLTKKEILDENLHQERIIHREGWASRVREVLKGLRAR